MSGKILIIDNAEIFRRELLKYHQKAEAFANFATAYNRIQSGDISLVVTELLDVTGSLPFSELVAAVKGLDEYVPIIAQSNKEYEDRVRIGNEYRLDATIPKSKMAKEFLLPTIDRLIKDPEAYRENPRHRFYSRTEKVSMSYAVPGKNGLRSMTGSHHVIQKKY